MRALSNEIAKRVSDASDIYYPTLLSLVPEKGEHTDQCITCASRDFQQQKQRQSRLVLRVVTGIDLKSDNRRFLYPALWYQCAACSRPLNEERVILIDAATSRQLTDELDRCARQCEEDYASDASDAKDSSSIDVLNAFFEIVHHTYPDFMRIIMSNYSGCMNPKCDAAADRWCNLCHAAWYCSDDCMALDWDAHHADHADCHVFSFRRLWMDHLGMPLNRRSARSVCSAQSATKNKKTKK